MEIQELKPHLNNEIVREILLSIGVEVNNNYQFVNDKSFSIRKDGYIKDFGTTGFNGDIFDFLKQFYNKTLPEAIEYVATYLSYDATFTNKTINLTPPPIKKEPQIDLTDKYKEYKANLSLEGKHIQHLESLFELELMNSCTDNLYKLNDYIGYSIEYDSITISLFSDEHIEAIKIRRAGNIKWKAEKGSKVSYIPHNINPKDKKVYIGFGTAEVLLFELLDLPYIVFQSDSIAKSIQHNSQLNELQALLQDKELILLIDDDNSCRSTIEPIVQAFIPYLGDMFVFTPKSLYSNYALLTGGFPKDIRSGEDFRDVCNTIKDKELIQKVLDMEYDYNLFEDEIEVSRLEQIQDED